MTNRDDFSAEIKRALAERAGHRCSFPGCPAVTIGPSSEGETSVNKTGMACHIAAAAGGPGARRYVPEMTKEQRASIENGIWMCYKHGKEVDADEKRFSILILKKWRELAEFRAQWLLDYGTDRPLPDYVARGRVGFAEDELRFSKLGGENQTIGEAFTDCCIEVLWPESIARAVRDVVIELVRNALTHGKAKECVVRITKDAIFVLDDGIDFSCLELAARTDGRGGSAAIKHLFAEFEGQVIVGAQRVLDRINQTMLAPASGLRGVGLTAPCCVHIDRHDWDVIKSGSLPTTFQASALKSCRILYIVLPSFVTPSDAYQLRSRMSPDALKGQQIVFVASSASKFAGELLKELFPGCRVLIPD